MIAPGGGEPSASCGFTLPLERILEDKAFNIRIFYGDIDLLAVELMTEGQREPVTVRREGGQFFLIDGHRRQRAFLRARQFEIVAVDGRHFVVEAGRRVREVSGPRHPEFDPERVRCRQVEAAAGDAELFASQWSYNRGKPFTVLERMIFISRLARQGGYTKEQLALKTGFSRTHIANARNLHAADPRLLDYVREGRLSQKLALRLLKAGSAQQQIEWLRAAAAAAERHRRQKILPKDLAWEESRPPVARVGRADTAGARLRWLASRLEAPMRFPPNPSAADRLGTLALIQSYAAGKFGAARLEAYLLGRE